MNDDLLKEILEIKQEIKNLNERVDKVTDKILEEYKEETIETDITTIKETLVKVEEDLELQPIKQPKVPNKNHKIKKEPIKQRKTQKKPEFKNLANLEVNIGKNIMGILASLLIFIGLASFVVFVFNDLSEIVKMSLMYVFSFGLFGLGLWRVNKNRNAFSLSLSGCGIGAVFISVLLSFFYFEFIKSEFILFGLLVSWSVVALVLSKKYKSDLFVIISYIGYYIALLLAASSGIELLGSTISTISIMILLHSVFIFLISSETIPTSELLFKVYSFISLIGSFILILFVFDSNHKFYSFFEPDVLLLYVAMLLQMVSNLYYILKLQNINIKEVFVTVILLLTCFVNILGFTSASQNFYVSYCEGEEPFFAFLIEKEKNIEENNDFICECGELYGYYDDDLDSHIYNHTEILDESYIGISMLFTAIVQFVFIEWVKLKNKFKDCRKILLYGLTLFIGFVLSCDPMFSTINALIGHIIPAIILLLYSKDDENLFKMSLIIYIIGVFAGCMEHNMSFLESFIGYNWLFSILNIAYLILAGFMLKKHYNLTNKLLYYLVSGFSLLFITSVFADYYSSVFAESYLIKIGGLKTSNGFIEKSDIIYKDDLYRFLNYDLSSVISYFVMSIYTLFIKLSGYCQDWKSKTNLLLKDKNESLDVVYDVNNWIVCILLAMGTFLIHDIYPVGIVQFALILMTSLQCFIGSRELLNRNNKLIEYYVGLKATIYINLIMGAFVGSDMGYLYSIACILIAVIAIILGFRINLKSFRLYGLILSCFSVLKLVMIDISYDNSLARIFSFIISGLLCFLIVWIYNKMSEKLKNENQ